MYTARLYAGAPFEADKAAKINRTRRKDEKVLGSAHW